MQANSHSTEVAPQIPGAGWNPNASSEHDDIRFFLTLPVTRLSIGPFQFDPAERFLGCSIAHLLEPAMTGPMFQRPSMAGPSVNVYPMGIPEGEGISIRLGHFGELGFHNNGGLLRLVVPMSASEWVRQRFASTIVRGPEPGLSMDGTSTVAYAWILLRPGMRVVLPIPHVGELGLEVV